MRRDSFSFPIWWLIYVVAIAACVLGSVVSWTREPTLTNVITGYTAAYGVPILVLAARKVSLVNVLFVAILGLLFSLPFAILFGALSLLASGLEARPIPIFLSIIVQSGWTSLVIAACLPSKPFFSLPARRSEIPEREEAGH